MKQQRVFSLVPPLSFPIYLQTTRKQYYYLTSHFFPIYHILFFHTLSPPYLHNKQEQDREQLGSQCGVPVPPTRRHGRHLEKSKNAVCVLVMVVVVVRVMLLLLLVSLIISPYNCLPSLLFFSSLPFPRLLSPFPPPPSLTLLPLSFLPPRWPTCCRPRSRGTSAR